jgi:hypothetical protein
VNNVQKIAAGATLIGALLGGGALTAMALPAIAATTDTSTTSTSDGHGGGMRGTETELTGDTATKVKDAVLAANAGATVDRLETEGDGSAVYEAHITKADGTQVEVQVSSDYTVAAVNTMAGHP